MLEATSMSHGKQILAGKKLQICIQKAEGSATQQQNSHTFSGRGQPVSEWWAGILQMEQGEKPDEDKSVLLEGGGKPVGASDSTQPEQPGPTRSSEVHNTREWSAEAEETSWLAEEARAVASITLTLEYLILLYAMLAACFVRFVYDAFSKLFDLF
ncbi:unnamed protein product [Enterobius vermicularis]|uniref:Peptidylprolyl isomerase n=1 Tax=Enterobius vermicularis TaxID=51028 RepID=A0A0N4V7L5_ENTVE|nr:unnamed protein product [Enterobius vermicularis]